MRLAVFLCLLAVTLAAPAQPPADATSGYRLEPGDLLTVQVWKEADLSSEVLIRPDGVLSFPLAGDVTAAGLTVEQLRTALELKVRRLVPEAAVSVAVKAPQGNRIYVIGKVQRPGDFMMVRPTDVMQAIALAGGATPFADLNDIKVLRRAGDRQTAVSFRYSDVERGRHLDQNIILKGGDTVVVP
jgi:polysaccharide biosynthesis/export protein